MDVNIHSSATQVQGIPHIAHHEGDMPLSRRSGLVYSATQVAVNASCIS